jgi:hypothetical protein
MKRDSRKSDDVPRKVIGQLATEKKKTVFAVCLILVMVLMWVRVLSNDKPEAAAGAATAQPADETEPSGTRVTVSYVELPSVPGRHDVIARDFFRSNAWRLGGGTDQLTSTSGTEVSDIAAGGDAEGIALLAEKLTLEAIVWGETPRAFINGQLVSVGDTLVVKDAGRSYQCEVVAIQEKKVSIECGTISIKLELERFVEVVD